ncbi:MAG TPA: peptidoglycan recognition family protein [Bryobacteraceae bacterium]|nr:peptidoglycan recognition family protein [Bryobacteraceae bacterium]
MKRVWLFPWSSVESQAGQIEDPVMRLRFLKVCAAADENFVAAEPGCPIQRGPAICFALLLAALLLPGYQASDREKALARPSARVASASVDQFSRVWLVDKTNDFETYSNGLRIDDRYAVSNDVRSFFPVYQRASIDPDQPEWRTEPAGIVYHTTESDQAGFEPGQNGRLKRIGQEVLNFVRDKRAYHFVIDRFGQVHRVVRESDVAYHAGNSVWADDEAVYVNLNTSFLGIAFETQTQRTEDQPSANPAQIHAASVLTEMLRSKYHIPAGNCVTHAQVSVNPNNMLIGYHTDWAGNFPFLDLGLKDNYAIPPASIYAFGFEYDPSFVHATGVRLWEGLALADDETRIRAMAAGVSVSQYRALLRHKYRQILATVKAATAVKETAHAT